MLSAEYRALRKEMQALYAAPDTARQLVELAAHLGMAGGGAALYFLAGHPLLAGAGALLSALGCLGISTSSHTASHGAIFRAPAANRALAFVGFPFLLMVSVSYWYHKHLVVHHPVPNVVGLDDDIDLAPWFAFSADDYAQSRGLRRGWYDLQWLMFPLALALNALNAQRQGVVFLVKKLRSRRRKAQHWLDLAALIAHVLVFWGLPLVFLPSGEVLLFHGLRLAFLGHAMFAALGAAHFPAEAVAVDRRLAKADYVLLQTATTVNFTAGPFGRLLCSGVDHQIEHHLFPEYAHTHYRKMAPRVRAFCRAHGYPYRTLRWSEAVWKSLRAMARPRPVQRHLDDLRRCADGSTPAPGREAPPV